MVPVLGRVASGLRQVARAEQQQDLDSPQTRRRSVRQRVWQSNTMLLGPVFGSASLVCAVCTLSDLQVSQTDCRTLP